jgi:hypothetical protein
VVEDSGIVYEDVETAVSGFNVVGCSVDGGV